MSWLQIKKKNHYFKVSSFLILYNNNKPFLDLIVFFSWSDCEVWWKVNLYENWQWPVQWLDQEEAPKYFPKPVQFSSVAQSCLTLCDPMDCSTPGFPVHHQLPELAQTHVHWVGDAIQPSHPLSSPSPPAFNLSQLQGLLQRVSSSHQVAKVLELQLQHQSFKRTFRTDFL